jgi:hypothetical protein
MLRIRVANFNKNREFSILVEIGSASFFKEHEPAVGFMFLEKAHLFKQYKFWGSNFVFGMYWRVTV